MAVIIVLIVLAVLVAGGVLGTFGVVRSDGYGSRPDRSDRDAPHRPLR